MEKLILLLLVILIAVAGVLATARMRSRGPQSFPLALVGWLSLAAGLLGAIYDGLFTLQVAMQVHVTRFDVVAPSLVPGAYALLLGIAALLISARGNRGGRAAS